jgi:hypothetical protein
MSRHSADAPRQAWRKRLARFARSGLPVARFCSGEGVSVASFYHWRKKLALDTAGPRPAGRGDAFQPLKVIAPLASVSIYLPGGTRIEVRAEDLDAVRTVVAEVARGNRGPRRDGGSC